MGFFRVAYPVFLRLRRGPWVTYLSVHTYVANYGSEEYLRWPHLFSRVFYGRLDDEGSQYGAMYIDVGLARVDDQYGEELVKAPCARGWDGWTWIATTNTPSPLSPCQVFISRSARHAVSALLRDQRRNFAPLKYRLVDAAGVRFVTADFAHFGRRVRLAGPCLAHSLTGPTWHWLGQDVSAAYSTLTAIFKMDADARSDPRVPEIMLRIWSMLMLSDRVREALESSIVLDEVDAELLDSEFSIKETLNML